MTLLHRSWLLLLLLLVLPQTGTAHPMPASVVLLDVEDDALACQLLLPLKELQLAVPQQDVTSSPMALLPRDSAFFNNYITGHLRVTSPDGAPWTVRLQSLAIDHTEQRETGTFYELVAQLRLVPPAGHSPRQLRLYYNGIMDRVGSHKILVAVRQDWDRGQLARTEENWETAGVIGFDPAGGVAPLDISLAAGSRWRGFQGMFRLGMQHISEGTDHLLFLLVLLLPAPLLFGGGRWLGAGGWRYSGGRLLKIVTAFTAGHSLTLLAGALGWLRLPSAPVEIVIALSILVTAVHALRPLFPGREVVVAVGFGLVHGLAFASTLADLHLAGGRMALSILGFNLGIEVAQLFVVLMVVPWLVLLSTAPAYKYIRIGGAVLAGIAALAWVAERMSGTPNRVTAAVETAADHARWGVLVLALLAGLTTFRKKPVENTASAERTP